MADSSNSTAAEEVPPEQVEGDKNRVVESKKVIAVDGKVKKGKWTIIDPFNSHPMTAPPPSMDDAPLIPLANANFISKMTFWWIQPLLVLGYKRAIEPEDLWQMDESRQSAYLGEQFLIHFDRRQRAVLEWNRMLDDGTFKPGLLRRTWWTFWHKTTGFGSMDGKRTVGMAMALSDTFFWQFWSAGIYKVVGDLSQVTSPLVTKQIIYYVTDHYNARVSGSSAPSIGAGVGYAILLFLMQLLFSLCQAQMLSRAGQVGVLARGSLISAVYRRAMVLSGKSRVSITNSKLVGHISTDISRIDFAASFFHFSWTCLIQLIEVLVIILVNIGVSSLTGFALVIVLMPLQTWTMSLMFRLRMKSMVFTDSRIKTISELLNGVRVMKLFAWEVPYLKRVHEFRRKELVGIRNLLTIRSANQAFAICLPLLASVIVFVTYSLTGHSQNPALIWTSISLLNLLRVPVMLLPTSLSTITDAKNAMNRLISVFTSETLEETFLVDPAAKFAVEVKSADFTWETSAKPEMKSGSKKEKQAQRKKEKKEEKEKRDPDAEAEGDKVDEPSKILDINLEIPRGELWIVCGSVGSGKSSLMQGLIGEMRKTNGSVKFGGSVGYCAQSAWILNATLRDNVLFGQPWDEERYWKCIKDSCLLPDLEQLPSGDLTQIGEKGIGLSGGQKQRVSICRTLYYNADIILLDDPLSALDAHVGAYVMKHSILGALGAKTRLLSTHALHFMPHADRILCVEDGKIVEQGSYQELIASDGPFARHCRDFGSSQSDESNDAKQPKTVEELEKQIDEAEESRVVKNRVKAPHSGQAEMRKTGSVSGAVYWSYLKAARAQFTLPLLVITSVLAQAAQNLSQFELTWWQDDQFGFSEGGYMGLYAGLGVASAIFTFLMGWACTVLGATATRRLHQNSIESVLRAPMSFFDTTPIGRILNCFTKDVDNLDNRMIDSGRFAIVQFSNIFGAFVVIVIVSQYFLIAIAVVVVIYLFMSSFYRSSAREIKRIDNVLRGELYAHFSESLAGLPTIRAFRETERFIFDNDRLVDLENRAYFLTVVNQRWLGIRLDFLGCVLVLVVSLLAVCQPTTFSASQVGLILSGILSVQSGLSTLIRQTAEVENNIASVERLEFYTKEIQHEPPRVVESHRPPASWPQDGAIIFQDVTMSYRQELSPALSDLTVTIRPGEKVGIVGRTGAGKSTLTVALFRVAPLLRGKIIIDGVDISTIGLDDLRKKISIIPQDALLFSGTLRSNLDPFGEHEDVALWDALKRASLVERADVGSGSGHAHRFTLDTAIEDEGSNMSVGERSLVSLARALVRDSKIVVLDEATASVDFETDAMVQRTIRNEFSSKTLLCIAHRINTIIGYDRILVLDKGRLVAFDTPAALFEEGGIFRGLCTESGISLDDINKAHVVESGANTPAKQD